MHLFLLEIDAALGTKLVASKTKSTKPSDTPPNTVYEGRITDPGQVQRLIDTNNGVIGTINANVATIKVGNSDGGLDDWLDDGFDGREFRLKTLDNNDGFVAGATLLISGTLSGLEASDAMNELSVVGKDKLGDLETPLLTERYAGTTLSGDGTIEGNLDLKGTIKPLCYGAVTNIGPKLVNPFQLIYQVSTDAVSSIAVYDGGVELTLDQDYPTLDTLVGATVAPGFYATDVTHGLFRLGGQPVKAVTADVVASADASERTAARIAESILIRAGQEVDEDSFDEFLAFNSAEVGIYIDDETNVKDLVDQVVGSVRGRLVPALSGELRVLIIREPADPVETYTERDLAEGASFSILAAQSDRALGTVTWSIKVKWGKIWQTMAEGDLLGSVEAERKLLLATEFRTAVAQDASVKDIHLLATEHELTTLLTQEADADVEAEALLDIYKVRRDVLLMPVPWSRGFDRDIGDVVTIQMDRFGYNGGKNFLVIGQVLDLRGNIVTLKLWG